MLRFILSLVLASSLIAGCSQSDGTKADTASENTESGATADAQMDMADAPASESSESSDLESELAARGVTLIAWEDLMPEGEEEILVELYEEFYREFEERLMQQQSTLMSSSEENEDLALSLIAEGSDMDTMEQIGTFNVVDDLNGMKIRLPGYIVPLDFSADAEHREFLLVPYFGACLHTPPPPPNQIIFVSAEPAAKIPNIYDPVWLEGTMSTGRFDTEMGNSAYELSLSKLEPYEF